MGILILGCLLFLLVNVESTPAPGFNQATPAPQFNQVTQAPQFNPVNVLNGKSRYFIEPSTDLYVATARPLNICHENSYREFTIYSCDTTSDPNNHILIAAKHGKSYPNCNSPNVTIEYFYQSELSSMNGAESFNCIGEDNYYILYEFINEPLCKDYIASNKNDESNENAQFVRKQYGVPNICYEHNILAVTSKNITHFDESLRMNYCNAYFYGYRFFEDDGTNCLDRYKNTFYEGPWPGSIFSPNVCSTDIDGDFNFTSVILHECVINGTVMKAQDYEYDETSLKQIGYRDRSALIDFAVSTADMNSAWFHPWAQYFCHFNGLGGWNFVQITEYGNIYQPDYETPVCGILIRDPSDVWTDQINLFSQFSTSILNFEYDDPFVRSNTNPLNKTIIYGLHFNSLEGISIGGSIPDSICNLLDLQYLWIQGHDSLYGSIPDCIGNLDIHRLSLITLPGLTGTIPSTLCNIESFHVFQIVNNANLTGSIPQCMDSKDFRWFGLWNNPQIQGTLPENILCCEELAFLFFSNNTGMDAQTMPNCWSDTRLFLSWTMLANSKLYGTLPPMPMVDYMPVFWIDLHGNQLEGTVSDIFQDMQRGAFVDFIESLASLIGESYLDGIFNVLQGFLIHDNLFVDEDISGFLEQIFMDNSGEISVVSLSNNKYITGEIPDLSNFTIKASTFVSMEWTGLLLHGLDLYGTIPTKLQLGDIDYLTLHNNRLSGYIPEHFKAVPTDTNITTSAVVLLGNLLWTRALSPPEWVNSKLRTAVNMYYTPYQQFEGYLVVLVGFIGIAVGILYVLMHGWFERKWFHHQRQLFEKKLATILFFDTMQTLRRLFAGTDLILFICTLILLVFYAFTSKYYAKVPVESKFSLPWYWINPQNGSTVPYIVNVILFVLCVLFNWLLLRLVNDLNRLNKQTKQEMKANKIEFKSQLKLKLKQSMEWQAIPNTPNTPDVGDEQQLKSGMKPGDFLPNGWRIGITNDGRTYYINDITKETEWSKPEILPNGWSIRYTQDNRLYYQNNITKKTQWERPQMLAPLPRGWEEAYTVDERIYYQNRISKETQWERPSSEANMNEIMDAYNDNVDDDNDDDDDIALEVMPEKKWKSVLKMFGYFIAWLLGLFGIMSYILSSSLPDENNIGVPSWIVIVFAKVMPLMLVFNDIFVIPGFAAAISGTFCDGIKGKYKMILILRLLNEIILPFIGSLFLLNDCGKYWTNFWTLCVDPYQRAQHFDISLDNFDHTNTVLLRSEDVCGSRGFLDFNFNKCLRSFLYNWTAVMMGKLVIGIFVQFFSFLWNVWRHKKREKQSVAQQKQTKPISVHICGEYMNITLTLLISLSFSFSAPMILPITLCEMFVKSWFFKQMRYKYKWKFDIKFAANNQTLPTKFLWIGFAFNQLFCILFFLFCVESGMVFGTLLVLALLVMDIYFMRLKCKDEEVIFLRDRLQRKQQQNENEYQTTGILAKQVTVYSYAEYWKCEVCTMINENSLANCKMCDNSHEDDLPPGWRVVFTDNHRKFYQNDITRETQWEKPTEKQEKRPEKKEKKQEKRPELVKGWTIMYTDDGRKYYQNNTTKETAWSKPGGLNENISNNVDDDAIEPELVKGWTIMYTNDGRIYYQNDISKKTSWNKPNGYEESVENKQEVIIKEAVLPKGWSKAYTNDGRIFYQNDITKVTSWEIPKEIELKRSDELSLPDGWCKIHNESGKVYYQNNKSKKTQWIHPTEKNLGWMMRYTENGNVFYQNEITKVTQWDKPRGFTE